MLTAYSEVCLRFEAKSSTKIGCSKVDGYTTAAQHRQQHEYGDIRTWRITNVNCDTSRAQYRQPREWAVIRTWLIFYVD